MPKITTAKITASTNALSHTYEVDIHYTSKFGFYAYIPENLRDKLAGMPEEQQKQFNIRGIFKGKYDFNNNAIPGVCTASEADTKKVLAEILKYLFAQDIVERQVILITFEGSRRENNGSRHNSDSNEQHGQISLKYSLKYCTELQVPGGRPKYIEYFQSTGFRGEVENVRRDISAYQATVIEDTPENRAFLERAYDLLADLTEKLQVFKTPSELTKFISNNQKLIG